MSPPDTNLKRQFRRHVPAVLAIVAALVAAVVALVVVMGDPGPLGEDQAAPVRDEAVEP